MLKNLARFLLVLNLIHGNDKHNRLLVQLVLNGLRRHQYELDPVCHVFELFVFEHIFGKKQSLLSLFIHGLPTME